MATSGAYFFYFLFARYGIGRLPVNTFKTSSAGDDNDAAFEIALCREPCANISCFPLATDREEGPSGFLNLRP